MEPAILRLHSHGWRSILDYLDTSDISRLVCLGSSVISSNVQHTVEKLDVLWSRAHIDLDKATTFASMFYRLSELSIRGHYGRNTVAKWPINVSLFPQRLTSLKMCFRHCTHAFFQLNFASSLPNLLRLELVTSSEMTTALSIANFPPLLQHLTLHGALNIDDAFGNLPRTLLELDLRGCLKLKSSKSPRFSEFMPGLTSLTVRGGTFDVDQFPPGLTKLHLMTSTEIISSALDCNLEKEPLYPWRSCFPRLIDLSLPMFHSKLSFSHIIDPQSLNKTREFAPIRHLLFQDLARSHAHSIACMDPDELANSDEDTIILDQTFATYKRLEIIFGANVHLEELDKSLIPLLVDLETCHVEGWPQPVLNWMRKLTYLNLGVSVPLDPNVIFCSTLTTLKAEEVLARLLPASLTSLSCAYLNCSNHRFDQHSELFHFPCPSLTELEIYDRALTADVASILPCSITSLTMNFPGRADPNRSRLPADLNESSSLMNDCDVTWTAIALRLDRLRKLIVKNNYGAPSRLLTPLVSTVFEELSLLKCNGTGAQSWLVTLLDGSNTVGRPAVLPPSTRILTLDFDLAFGPCVHTSVLALAPRSLTSLTTSSLTSDSNLVLPNSPLHPNLSSSDMFGLLPPNLRSLRCINPDEVKKQIVVSSETLAVLPQSLEIFDLKALVVDFGDKKDDISVDQAHVARVVKLMPPGLSVLVYGFNNLYTNLYFSDPARQLLNSDCL